MKTITAVMQQHRQLHTTSHQKMIPAAAESARETLALLSAVMTGTVIVMLSIWAAGMEISNILGAASWGMGLIFLGLAVDNREPTALLQLLSGLTLLVLATLQNTVSPDYIIVSGVLVATWAAALFYRYLR